jgi:hypothetical protein
LALRQEVLNVVLAQLLQRRGLVVTPERILKAASEGPRQRHIPDVMVDFQGLRLVIEGDFDTGSAESDVAAQTRERVEKGISHLGVAVLYPSSLRSVAFPMLEAELEEARLRFAVVTEDPEAPNFAEGRVEDLSESLRRAYEQLAKDQVLERAVNMLRGGIERFTTAVSGQPAVTDRFAHTLGIRQMPRTTQKADEE